MLFSSLAFAVFLPLVLLVYWRTRRLASQQYWLLAASLVFYGWWDYRFLALILLVTLVAYLGGLSLAWRPLRERKPLLLGLCLALVLAPLAYFKYANFFALTVANTAEALGLPLGVPHLSVILPVGISFFTFQAISYLVDVHRGNIPASASFLRVALYISYFPQLVAGPIVRASDFLPQLEERRRFDPGMFAQGIQLFVVGFVYKTGFADHIATFVDPVFGSVATHTNLDLVAATIGFYCQIYFDFAGYSLMAIGIARLFGFWLPDNFNYPYRAASIIEFWRRWHISLSHWLRDYLYIPLGGSRGSFAFTARNLMLTMLLGGLWHGASWNFVLWGGLHGGGLVVNRVWREHAAPRLALLQHRRLAGGFYYLAALALTQCFVLLCWIPFRAESAADSFALFAAFLGLRTDPEGAAVLAIPWAILLLPILLDTWVVSRLPRLSWPGLRRPGLSYLAYGFGFALALMAAYAGSTQFIYFQF